jgi:hypothetical protein
MKLTTPSIGSCTEFTLAVKKDPLNLKQSYSAVTPLEMFCSSVYLIRTGVASLIQSE